MEQIIFINDGSTDTSLEILELYQKKDSRIKIINQQNSNAGKARNDGLDIAIGEYLSFLDADDLFELEMLETMYNEAKKYNTDIIICDFDRIDAKTKSTLKIPSGLTPPKKCIGNVFSARDYPEDIFTFNTIACWNKLYLHSFIKVNKIRFQEIKKTNDMYFSVVSLITANRIKIIDDKFIHYRLGNDTQLTTRNEYCIEKPCLLLSTEAIVEFLSSDKKYEIFRLAFADISITHLLHHLSFTGFDNYENHKNMIVEFWKKNFSDIEFKNITNNVYVKAQELRNPGFTKDYFKSIYKAQPYKYIISDESLKNKRKVILYGAGDVGLDYYLQLILEHDDKEVTWVDSRSEHLKSQGYPIEPVDCLSNIDFDVIIIAVLQPKLAREITETLTNLGIPENKILWMFE